MPQDSQNFLKQAEELFNQGDYQGAIQYYDKALELDPKNAWAWGGKGAALANLGSNKEAINCFDKALEIDPKNALAWGGKGVALANLGRHEEAIKCYDKALEIKEIEPKVAALAWNSKGWSLANLGRYEEVIKCYDKALEIDPKNAWAWFNKGNALSELDRYQEAITCYEKTLEIDPTSLKAKKNLQTVRARLKGELKEFRPRRGLLIAGLALTGISGLLLIACLVFYFFRFKQVVSGNNLPIVNSVEVDVLKVLIPTFLAAILAGIFLPYIKALSLPGGVKIEMWEEPPRPPAPPIKLEKP